jgi:hypothetical protein
MRIDPDAGRRPLAYRLTGNGRCAMSRSETYREPPVERWETEVARGEARRLLSARRIALRAGLSAAVLDAATVRRFERLTARQRAIVRARLGAEARSARLHAG